MAGYNLTRSVEELLDKTSTLPPSFTIHFYKEHWTLNNGSKFLYGNQVAVRIISPFPCRATSTNPPLSRYSMTFGRIEYPLTFWSSLTWQGYRSTMVRPVSCSPSGLG